MVSENQPMLPPGSASAPQFVGSQFMDSYPQNYGDSSTSLPNSYDSGAYNGFGMVCLPDDSNVT